jgi:hypothetical protein
MITIKTKVNIDGLRRYRDNLNVLEQVVMFTAAAIEGEAKQSIEERSSKGNEYHRAGKIHYAAKPGNAPNSDTTKLSGSITHRPLGKTKAEVVAETEYAIPLELGWISKDGAHQGPFPFMVPAVNRHAGPFRQAVTSVMRGKQP